MGSISLLTVVALSIAIYYANAMRNTGGQQMRTDPRRPILRRILTFESTMPGQPASSDQAENIRRVTGVIDRNMVPNQQSSIDPCRQYQIVKERQLAQEGTASQTSRSQRRSSSRSNQDPLTPNAEAAMTGCSSAVNAFLALPESYKTACPKVRKAGCKNIDSYLTCSVIIPSYAFNCIPLGTTYLSLKRCADFAIQERDRQQREEWQRQENERQMAALSARARAVAALNAGPLPPPAQSAPAGPRPSGSQGGSQGGGQGGGRRASPAISEATHIGRNSQDRSGPSNWQGNRNSGSGSW